jgi:flagellar motor switch protein FliN/FliY
MAELHQGITSFFDAFRTELEQAISAAASVGWRDATDEPLPEDLVWWSGNRGSEPDGALLAGASTDTWELIRRLGSSEESAPDAFAILARCLEAALAERFGPAEVAGGSGAFDSPPDIRTKVVIEVQDLETTSALYCLLSPQLEAALAPSQNTPVVQAPGRRNGASKTPMDMLMQVEVPVSVSFGRTRIRMKDLLNLTPGSVVELDQSLGEEVEVWVNNCAIAKGEVVAVDGNYGVRILELVGSGVSDQGGNRK